jgi:hypothetical protein
VVQAQRTQTQQGLRDGLLQHGAGAEGGRG